MKTKLEREIPEHELEQRHEDAVLRFLLENNGTTFAHIKEALGLEVGAALHELKRQDLLFVSESGSAFPRWHLSSRGKRYVYDCLNKKWRSES